MTENFLALCKGEKGIGKSTGKPLHFKGSHFHRIIKRFMAQLPPSAVTKLILEQVVSMRKPKLFWVSAGAPLVSVILSTLLVFAFKIDHHGPSIFNICNVFLVFITTKCQSIFVLILFQTGRHCSGKDFCYSKGLPSRWK
ncbi:hypothetical protein F2P56_008616 [Juglans regia]|uniref:PPIase cyclophilin-type domain-containing protein n=1 Tax=Juglans regia TaxID=51240 RepID=A0A834CYR2_JUGRE|nr:hypothetical protein F2P56_008616 [Juglans regia]